VLESGIGMWYNLVMKEGKVVSKSSKSKLLEIKSRVERLREIVGAVKRGEQFSAFDLAVKYNVSINVIYRDIKTLKDEGLIPNGFEFARKER